MSGLIGGDPAADNKSSKKSGRKIGFSIVVLGVVIALIVVLVLNLGGEDGKFSEWSDCNKECGGGTQTRTYTPPTKNGKDLPDKNILSQSCNTQPCPIDGTYNNWSNYGNCVTSETDNTPITCGTGKKSRTRTYNAPQYGGKDHSDYRGNNDLDRRLIEWENCTHSLVPNCPIDGKYSQWSGWGSCVKSKSENTAITCGSGEQKRIRTYTQPQNGGLHHPDYQGTNNTDLENKLIEWRSCIDSTTPNCPIDGTYNNWSNYGTCVKSENDTTPITCGTGKKSRTRTYNAPQYNGVHHSDYVVGRSDIQNKLKEWADCTHGTTPNCPENGSYSNWISEGQCVKSSAETTAITCGSGVQKRVRTYTQPQHGGAHHSEWINAGTNTQNTLVNWTQTCQAERLCQSRNASCSAWENDGLPTCRSGQYQQKQKRTYTPAVDGGTELSNNEDNNLCKTRTLHERFMLAKSDPNNVLSEGVCPANGVMTDFSASNNANCTPTSGRPRHQYVVATYTFPTSDSQSHDTKFTNLGFSNAQINTIKGLTHNSHIDITVEITGNKSEYTIKRTNNTFPYTYEIKKKISCDPVYTFSIAEINTAWKQATGCTQDLTDTIYTTIRTSNTETIDDLRYLENIETNVKPKFTAYTTSLLSTPNTNNITTCYGTGGYVTVNASNKSNYSVGTILLPGFKFTATDVAIVQNSNYRLLIHGGTLNGKFMYVKLDNWNNILFGPSYTLSNFGSLIMQHDGNLVVYSNATPPSILWQSNTNGNNGAFLELATNGSLMIKNSSGAIIKYLYISPTELDTKWKAETGCTQDLTSSSDGILSALGKTFSELTLLDTITNITNTFNPFKVISLLSTPNTNNIKLCYGENINTGYVTVNASNKSNYSVGTILLPGFKFTATDVAIVNNPNYRLLIGGNGKLRYVKLDNWSDLFSPSYTGSNFGSLVMQHDGNLVIYSNATPPTVLWQSNTSDNNGAYLELTTNGSLMIKNSSGTIIKYLYSNGLMTSVENNSPSNFPEKSESLCTPALGTRTQNVKVNYTFPTIDNGSHDANFTAIGFSTSQISTITNLNLTNSAEFNITVNNNTNKYIVKRTNNSEPKTYEITKTLACEYIPINWKGYGYSTTVDSGGRRCGPNFNDTACPDNQCCSSVGYCGGTTGGNDAYCTGSHSNGNYNDKEPKNWNNKSYSTTVVTGGTRCGPEFGACSNNQCCSSVGYCGGTTGGNDAYCTGSHSNGQYNHKEPKNWNNYSYSTTTDSGGRRCGPDFNNTACPDNQCCSSVGYCGGTTGGNDAYCTGSKSGGNYNDKEPTAIIHGVTVKEIVLLNKHAQPIYIEPHVFKRIIDDNSINNDNNANLSCTGDQYDAVTAYNIDSDTRFAELKTSSKSMQQKYTFATEFIREDGAIHNNSDSDKLHNCTQFWNLYSEGRYSTEKNNLINAGFKYFAPNDANDAKNWLRDSVGASRYSRYWKVFYR
jgi:hypothetical protein